MTRQATWKAVRWGIAASLFAITVINYLDRQSLSLLAPVIQKQLKMSDESYAHIVTAFLVAYTIAYVLAGRITDWLGSCKSMVLFVVWWSLSEMIPPFAHTARMLGFGRFMLGLGEAGNYVVAPKAISEWFDPAERGMAIGIYTAGATIGATLAPLLVASLSSRYGWASVFFVTGSLGLLWILPWLFLYKKTAGKPRAKEEDPQRIPEPLDKKGVWAAVFRRRTTWYLMIARFLTDPVWYFYLFWYPKYMVQARHLTITRVGYIIWVVYLAADIGTLLGGYFSGRLIRKGATPLSARRKVMTFAACVMPFGSLAALLPSVTPAVSVAAMVAFAHMAWLVTLTALLVDEYPASQVATAAGLIAAGSGLGGILSTELIGLVVMHSGYVPVFLTMSILHLVALFFLWNIREFRAQPNSRAMAQQEATATV